MTGEPLARAATTESSMPTPSRQFLEGQVEPLHSYSVQEHPSLRSSGYYRSDKREEYCQAVQLRLSFWVASGYLCWLNATCLWGTLTLLPS